MEGEQQQHTQRQEEKGGGDNTPSSPLPPMGEEQAAGQALSSSTSASSAARTSSQPTAAVAPNTHTNTSAHPPSSSSATPLPVPPPSLPPVHDLEQGGLSASSLLEARQLWQEALLRASRANWLLALTPLSRLLALLPAFVPGWVAKGVAYRHLKDHVSSLHCLQTAVSLSPTDWQAHCELGLLLKETDMLEEAQKEYRLAIQYAPADQPCPAREHLAVVLTDLGTRVKLAGDSVAAVHSYTEALSVHPHYWPAHFNLGVVYSERRQFDRAMQHYQMAVERNPNYVEALTNVGVLYKNQGELRLAIDYYERALKANPNFSIANSNLAIALTDLGTQVKNEGHLDESIRLYKRALHHQSKYPAAWYNLAVAKGEKGEAEDAKVCYEMAVLFDPKCAEALNNLGVYEKERGNLDMAIQYYTQALQANPHFSQTMNNLSVVMCMLGKLDEAHKYCKQAIDTNPQYAEAWNNMGVLRRDEGLIEEALQAYEACLAIDPHSRNAGQNRLLAMNSLWRPRKEEGKNGHSSSDDAADDSSPDSDPSSYLSARDEMVWRAHRQWGQHFQARFDKQRFTSWEYAHRVRDDQSTPSSSAATQQNGHHKAASAATAASSASRVQAVPSSATPLSPLSPLSRSLSLRRPLRIGYLSADFFTHSVSYFIEAPLSFADPTRTHITCYSNVARRDKKTAHLQSLAHAWRHVHDQSALAVAQQIRADRIDILVELTGHTAGNRLDVMALKPAPISITWIGYPNTTGLPTIDYRLTDEVVDPPDTQQQYSEELVRLPGPFLCYTPPVDAPPVSPTPALSKGYVTFGSFNNLAKVNDAVLSCWVSILHRVPNSRMLLKCKPFASATVCNKMWQRFADRGISSDRVELIPLLPSTSEHLSSYSQVDISVDTFPYAGTTTTCEALFCGVPIVTYQAVKHPNHAHNVGATLLQRIPGMEKLVARSEQEYIDLAVALASDIPALADLRSRLRASMLASPLCDGRQFVDTLSATYEKLWERYCKGEKPKPSNREQA